MKRSARIKLLLMGSVTLALSACGDSQEEAGVFSSIDECIATGKYTEDYCKKGFDQAREQHEKVAPRYNTKADCESDFGSSQCQAASHNGTSVFLPLMAGFLVGRMLSGGQNSFSQPLYRPNTYPPGQPYPPQQQQTSSGGGYGGNYSGGSYRTANNVEVAQRTGVTKVGSSITSSPPSVRTTTISRGGFGASAASSSSSGG